MTRRRATIAGLVADKPDIRIDLRRVARWAATAGAVLGLLCPALPAHYQAPCAVAREVISACTGAP